MSQPPQAAIAVIVEGGKVLLGKRTAYKPVYANCWDYIDGGVEPGETSLETLSREMKEELGICPTDAQFLQEYVDRQLNPDNPPTYHFFLVTAWDGGPPHVANDEHSQIAWFTIDALRSLPDLADRAFIEMAERALAVGSNSHKIA